MKNISLFACFLFVANICFANDDASLLFNVTGSSTSVIVSTVAPNHTYPAAGIKIKTAGYQLSGVGSECTMANTEYCLFSVSDTAPKTFSITGSGNALEITLCLNGNGPLSCQDYMIGTGAGRVANALYVINATITSLNDSSRNDPPPPVSLCPLDPATQLITSCDSAFDPSSILRDTAILGIALNDAGDKAYISGSSDLYFYQCDVDTSTQLLSNCNEVPTNTPTFFSRNGLVALSPAGDYGYFIESGELRSNQANAYDGEVLACAITDGNMSGDNCVEIGMTVSAAAGGIAINQIAGQNYIYVANYGENTVTVCPLTSSTTVGSCNNIAGGGAVSFLEPIGVGFNPANHLLYVTDEDNGFVYACESTQASVNAFTDCQATTASSIGNVWAIVFNTEGTMAYITTDDTTLLQCHVDQTDGVTFDVCTTLPGFATTVGLALGYK